MRVCGLGIRACVFLFIWDREGYQKLVRQKYLRVFRIVFQSMEGSALEVIDVIVGGIEVGI